ncbi:MAG: hypothetical protein Q7R97_02775 [Candidatus Daviesbacteria bacterium]|nr:hypothetical protein [Candidatus Daviesbacteria bacterium]
MSIKEKGISLIEIILVAAVVMVLTLLLGTVPSAMSSINKSRHNSIAREIAAKQIEYLKRQPYINLAEGVNSFADINLDKLSGSSSSYEIKACSASVCTNGEDVKEVKVSVFWNEVKEPSKVEFTTLIYAGGIGQ